MGYPPYRLNTRMMIEKHNAIPEDIHLKAFSIFDFRKQIDASKKSGMDVFKENLEIAELIQLLYDSLQEKSTLNISTTIKGIKREVNISSFSSLKTHLWMLSNTILEEIQDGLYQYEFKIPFKERLGDEYNGIYQNYTEVYSNAELEKIIQYERETVNRIQKNNKKRLALIIQRFVFHYREDNVFDSTKKTIATNEACFLYDSLDILGIIHADIAANNNDKYEFIKKELRK
ncbi:MAG: hypothetical protein H6Q14_1381 [Bacteroidetes bacterium]|nr:hypothetical protein [Bacteroidota bacterium]